MRSPFQLIEAVEQFARSIAVTPQGTEGLRMAGLALGQEALPPIWAICRHREWLAAIPEELLSVQVEDGFALA